MKHFIAMVCAAATLMSIAASANQNGLHMNQQKGGQSDQQSQQMMSETHRLMAESYLKASQVFADGLDGLISANLPLNNKLVQEHVNNYIKGTMENLQQARTHIRQFASMSRMPASASQDSQKTTQHVTQVSQDIDRAIQAADALKKNDWKTSQRDQVQKQVSELKDQIKSAMSNEKNLKQS
jgi:hypothetical protein